MKIDGRTSRSKGRPCVGHAGEGINERRETGMVPSLEFRADQKIVNARFELIVLSGCGAGGGANGNWKARALIVEMGISALREPYE
jgi:hypothetical protein